MVTFSLQGEKPVVTPSSYSRSTQEEIIIMLQITTNRLIQTQGEKKKTRIFFIAYYYWKNIIHFKCKTTKCKFEKRNALEFFPMQGLISSQGIDNEIV
jgi:hypothetical protein